METIVKTITHTEEDKKIYEQAGMAVDEFKKVMAEQTLLMK